MSWFCNYCRREHENSDAGLFPQISEVSGEYIAKRSADGARVLYNNFRPDPVHPKGPEGPDMPFVYDPADDIVHLGPAQSYHWNLIQKTPELRSQYPVDQAYLGPPYASNRAHLHGRMAWPSKNISFYGASPEETEVNQYPDLSPYKDRVTQGLGGQVVSDMGANSDWEHLSKADPYTCATCGSHAMTEPVQNGAKWFQTCTACGRTTQADPSHPAVQQFNDPSQTPYPPLLQSVMPTDRPMWTLSANQVNVIHLPDTDVPRKHPGGPPVIHFPNTGNTYVGPNGAYHYNLSNEIIRQRSPGQQPADNPYDESAPSAHGRVLQNEQGNPYLMWYGGLPGEAYPEVSQALGMPADAWNRDIWMEQASPSGPGNTWTGDLWDDI